jgi:hypothetical protein
MPESITPQVKDHASQPADDLPDPFGTIIIKKGDVRTGGSYWNHYSLEFVNGRE